MMNSRVNSAPTTLRARKLAKATIKRMFRSLTLHLLIALQLLASLAWSANIVADDKLHSAGHVLLAHHHHDDPASHHHDHQIDPLLELQDRQASSSAEASADHHHHHDLNVTMALLLRQTKLAAADAAIQNPRLLPAMQSAYQRPRLRPPQA